MKRILFIVIFVLVLGYLWFSVSYFKDKPKEETCGALEVVIANAAYNQFIDTEEIVRKIKNEKLDPTGKLLKEVNTVEIEELILKNQHIKKAEVFVTNKNNIKIVLEERKPIIRIIPDAGESYYIDDTANRMPLSERYAAYLPVATGQVKESFAKEELYKFALFLHKDKFWNAQIEQIIVKPNNDIEFVPRVGDQTIVLGQLNDFEDKLDKLMDFYKNGLNRIGWNKYSVINVKYNKQVVCTRR